MKIGIMSMQRVKNYGSFLQAYGLKKMIEKMGHEVEFVDYKVEAALNIPPISVIPESTFSKKIEKKIHRIIQLLRPSERKFQKMELKRKEFLNTYDERLRPMLGIDEIRKYNSKVDTLVIGSDEVFNCLQESKDVGYSRELFGKDNCAKRVISYAGSFGNTTVERLKKYAVDKEVGELLGNMNAISVRDANSGNVVRELTGKEPVYNLDPVLISDYSDEEVQNVPEKDYIIVYGYSGRITKEEGKIIRAFAKKEKKKLICIQGVHRFCDKYVLGTPFEVLAYFRNADYIITDTFHGSIFSIINNKPFVTLVRKSVNESYGNEEKLSDLLKRLKLSNRIIEDMSQLESKMKEHIDYEAVQKIRSIEREKSIDYLKQQFKLAELEE